MPMGAPASGKTGISGRSARAANPQRWLRPRSQNKDETSPKGKVPSPSQNKHGAQNKVEGLLGLWGPQPLAVWHPAQRGPRSYELQMFGPLTFAVGNVVAGHPARTRSPRWHGAVADLCLAMAPCTRRRNQTALMAHTIYGTGGSSQAQGQTAGIPAVGRAKQRGQPGCHAAISSREHAIAEAAARRTLCCRGLLGGLGGRGASPPFTGGAAGAGWL